MNKTKPFIAGAVALLRKTFNDEVFIKTLRAALKHEYPRGIKDESHLPFYLNQIS
jgi:hypothetical protein